MSAGVVNNPRRLLVSLFDDEAEYEDSLSEDEPTGRYYAWIQHDAAIDASPRRQNRSRIPSCSAMAA